MKQSDVVLITGSSGFIGQNIASALAEDFHVIGLDRAGPKTSIPGFFHHDIDITSKRDVAKALGDIKKDFGNRLHSVIHLVAYYDFQGGEDERYETITINGTRSLLRELNENFEVGQFIFSSSMLVYRPSTIGQKITDDSPLAPSWPYPQSKVDAEKVLKEEQKKIPVVNLRIAGVYDDDCHSPTISQQIMRIYEGWFSSILFPGDPDAGQSFLHIDDLRELIVHVVKRTKPPKHFENFIIGEEKVMSFREVQHDVGMLLHKRPWPAIRVPQFVARMGARLIETLPFTREPFIKPWMVEHSDENFDVDTTKARETFNWNQKRSLKTTIPVMISKLKSDPEQWYKVNKIELPFYRRLHMIGNEGERNYFLAACFNIFLGLWLLANPFTFGKIEGGEFASEIFSGGLVVVLASLSLAPTLRWLRWVNATIGFWLLFSPLVFSTESAAAYSNDNLLGGLIILASAYTPSMNKELGTPPGWSYNPSTPGQRLPIMLLGFIGFLGSRYLAAYQLGHIDSIWDPFFGEGTSQVLTSDVSKAFPISDAGLGALTYLLDVIAAAIGGRDRWRSLPWAVILFGIMIIPSGITSITLVMLQPISVGAWCTICLFTAFIMLLMVPPAVDEVLASVQFLRRRKKAGDNFWRVFLFGSNVSENIEMPELKREGTTIHLYASVVLSLWLMFSPTVLNIDGVAASSTYIVAALAATFSIVALSEVARISRFVNIPVGLWLALSGWFLDGMNEAAKWHALIAGLILIILSIPRGRRQQVYGPIDKIVHWTPLRRFHGGHSR